MKHIIKSRGEQDGIVRRRDAFYFILEKIQRERVI